MKNKEIKILLSSPRGFRAGVERAIEIVEKSIQKYGAPVYVRHEIVHNKYVVDDLKSKGAIFVEELEEIVDKTRPVIFSAHGVPKKIPEDAKNYKMTFVDATCPLVSKVHREAENLIKAGKKVCVFDVSKEMLEKARERKFDIADSFENLLSRSPNIVITMLPAGKNSIEIESEFKRNSIETQSKLN